MPCLYALKRIETWQKDSAPISIGTKSSWYHPSFKRIASFSQVIVNANQTVEFIDFNSTLIEDLTN
ncbi:hypothetical protein CYV28_08665 [Carnobacterium maltaromaticum]|nr:hypothetical protein CYV28_08665 [Carnobacterium maltaromaticum]PLS48726.1 hypothetical protein CYV32_04285 [Carnobacterium maltaromaticum]